MTEALTVQNLNKSFGAIQVAKDISITLEQGARHALIGPNGAGKTSLVGILSGVITPNSGQILLFGQDITKDSPSLRTRKGLVRTFQVSNLFTNLTVLENVYLAVSESEIDKCLVADDVFRGGSTATFLRPSCTGAWTRSYDVHRDMRPGLRSGTAVSRATPYPARKIG